MGVVGRKRTPPSRISSEGGEGGGWKETAPSVSHFKRGRGGGWLEGNSPLCLALQARERRGVVGRKRPPLSRIMSKGGEGGGWKETAPSVSHFKRGRGGGWLEGNGPLRLAFRAREGRGWL